MRWVKCLSSTLAIAVALAGCSVGPQFEPATVSVPSDFDAASETTSSDPAERQLVTVDPEAVDEQLAWWRSFGDPVLVELIESAVSDNWDVEIALARVREARAIRSARAGRLLPAVGLSSSAGKSRASARGPGPLGSLAEAGLASLENEVYSVGFDTGWELDLFGGVRRGREASQARLEASEESLRAVLLSVAAGVADAYTQLRGAELRLGIATRNLEIQATTEEVIDAKVESGLLAPIDLQRTRTQRSSLEAALAPLRAARVASLQLLTVLTGKTAGTLEHLLSSTESAELASVPVPPEAISAGLPAELLMRRPDLRVLERQLHASTVDIGVAVADRFPKVSIGGSFGLESASLSDLLDSAARTWSFGPSVTLPIFQGGRLAAQVEAARARLQIAEAAWQRSVLSALAEVETGLVAHQEARNAYGALLDAESSSRRTSELAGVLYELGLRDHLVLLDAQRSQTAIEDAVAQAKINVARSAIDLYRALGGGWQQLEERLQVSNSNALEAAPTSETSLQQ